MKSVFRSNTGWDSALLETAEQLSAHEQQCKSSFYFVCACVCLLLSLLKCLALNPRIFQLLHFLLLLLQLLLLDPTGGEVSRWLCGSWLLVGLKPRQWLRLRSLRIGSITSSWLTKRYLFMNQKYRSTYLLIHKKLIFPT